MKAVANTGSGPAGAGDVVLVGNPNVGKSVVFGCLTGAYVTVSNYPGTTVEVTRGRLNGSEVAVVDTPGIHSLVPFSDDERVTRDIVLGQGGATVVQVADAKNLARALAVTPLSRSSSRCASLRSIREEGGLRPIPRR